MLPPKLCHLRQASCFYARQCPRTCSSKTRDQKEKWRVLFAPYLKTAKQASLYTHSHSDILIYELRMHWLPTTKIDLVVHLIQPVSEFESNYDSGADRQAITFLFCLSFSLASPPPQSWGCSFWKLRPASGCVSFFLALLLWRLLPVWQTSP